MTEEDAFQSALDSNPDDATTRLVFADWLDERGDPRASGYRALGRYGRSPCIDWAPPGMLRDRVKHPTTSETCWGWWSYGSNPAARERLRDQLRSGAGRVTCAVLPFLWAKSIKSLYLYGYYDSEFSVDFLSRREADDAAAIAYFEMTPKDQKIVCETLGRWVRGDVL